MHTTENEWNLRRENLQLRIELLRAQSQLAQVAHDQAQAALAALGEKWVAPTEEKAPA
jgi:hypothetical protein